MRKSFNPMIKLNRFARFAWAVTAFNILVIVWGAYVRASESGDGCGSHWPLCDGAVVPSDPAFKTVVEMTHRATSGIAFLLVLALLVKAFRAFPSGHRVRKATVLSFVFITAEALIGAGLVMFGLVAKNDSAARAVVLAIHLTNTFMLLASLALSAWWGSGAPSPQIRRHAGSTQWLFAGSLAGTLLIGVSGAIAALGDTLYPSQSLVDGVMQDISGTSHLLIRLRLLHPVIAFAVGALVFFTASIAARTSKDPWVRRWSNATIALLFAQVVIGMTNVAMLAPIGLQLLHLVLADLLWLGLVLLAASSLAVAENETEAFDELRAPARAES